MNFLYVYNKQDIITRFSHIDVATYDDADTEANKKYDKNYVFNNCCIWMFFEKKSKDFQHNPQTRNNKHTYVIFPSS